ncbi:MAG: hypothetical protein RR640_01430 [Oscillospiraceae bacterium]
MLNNADNFIKNQDKQQASREEKQKRVERATKKIISMQNVKTDPFGSYTGVPEVPTDKPIQDADDL